MIQVGKILGHSKMQKMKDIYNKVNLEEYDDEIDDDNFKDFDAIYTGQ